jgi:hypothetical protein
VNLAALKLAGRIGLHPSAPAAGALLAGASFVILLWHAWTSDRGSIAWLAGCYGLAVAAEAGLGLRRRTRRASAAPRP